MGGPGVAICCPDGVQWRNFSSTSISFSGNAVSSLALTRYSDGLYAKLVDEQSTKEMYQLSNGLYLYRGYRPSSQAGPSPFFMLDMPVGIVLNFLAQHFKSPCSVGQVPESFAYLFTSGPQEMDVKGSAHRVGASTVVFRLTALMRKGNGASINASGEVAFVETTPVPPDTVVSDWVIARGSGIGSPAEIVVPNGAALTVKDLAR
jgi:hypothetical protein